jgi:hypothetical protein
VERRYNDCRAKPRRRTLVVYHSRTDEHKDAFRRAAEIDNHPGPTSPIDGPMLEADHNQSHAAIHRMLFRDKIKNEHSGGSPVSRGNADTRRKVGILLH